MSRIAARVGLTATSTLGNRSGREIAVDADPAGRDAGIARTIAAAAEVMRQHTPDAHGWCRGCLALWGRLMFIERCTQLQWAAAVRAAYVLGRRDDRPTPPRD